MLRPQSHDVLLMLVSNAFVTQCPMFDLTGCRMKPSKIQASEEDLGSMMEYAYKLGSPPRFGGWVLMGAIYDFYGVMCPRPLIDMWPESTASAQGRTALVEAMVYVQVRGNPH